MNTVDPHLSEQLRTNGWLNMRNFQITETGGIHCDISLLVQFNIMLHVGSISNKGKKRMARLHFTIEVAIFAD